MKIIVEPSFQDFILRKIAIFLWNRENVKSLVMKYVSQRIDPSNFKHEWRNLENESKINVSCLALPNRLKKRLLFVLKPIGLQIKDWAMSEEGCLFITNHKFDITKISWTPLWMVDRQQPVISLVCDDAIDICLRYELACKYCLEDELPELWHRLPTRKKNYYLSECEGCKMDMVIRYWTLRTSGRFSSDIYGHRTDRYMFEHVQYSKNMRAMGYFWGKMNLSNQRATFLNFFMNKENLQNYSEGLFFLLSNTDEELHAEVFEKFPLKTLSCFLCWPLQLYFIEMAKQIIPYLSCPDYGIMLNNINKLDLYQELLKEFWMNGSQNQKDYVMDHVIRHSSLLINLLENNDHESILLLLGGATTRQKRKIIFPDECGSILWDMLVYEKRWDDLQFLIFSCTPTRYILDEFITKCVELPKHANGMSQMKKFGDLLQTLGLEEVYENFLNNLLFEYGYPNEELSKSPPPKRRCL